MAKALHITLAQLNPTLGDLDYNLGKIRKVRDKAPANTDLIVYPEMIICGYPPEDLVLKPFFIDEVEKAVGRLVSESKNHKSWLSISAPHRHEGTIHNATHIIGNGKIQATRFKHNLPNYGVFDEARIFKSGPLPDPVEIKGYKIGFMLCEDMWYPEVSRHLKKLGAEMLIVSNASPYDIKKNEARLHNNAKKRVEETGLPLIYVNQVGGQDELVFDGRSFVLSESGNLIMQAEEFTEETHHTIWEETGKNEQGITHWICTSEQTPPVMDNNKSVYMALVTGVRDYVVKNGFSGVLIGMSGGIDSALSAAIAVDALGNDAVHCVMMPSPYTSRESLEDARECTKNLGCRYEEIPISDAMKAFDTTLETFIDKKNAGATFENIQSRIRGMILMALSNAGGYMVLSTGNKSEMAVGYTTLYGDMCGGFNALKDIYKTRVYELSRWRNKNKPQHCLGKKGELIPQRIITKPPSAELKHFQKDEDTLPPYDELDAILRRLVEKDLGIDEIVEKGYNRDTVMRIWRMLHMAEYKRRQAPPGVKITTRSFGRDRRYPITNRFTY